jgi:dynein heavy chain
VNFVRNKKNSSINGNKYDFLCFIDDLNFNYSCEKKNHQKNTSSNAELVRQLIETQTIYENQEFYPIPTDGINMLLSCTYPNRSATFVPLTQSQTKEIVPIHLSANPISLIRSIFSSTVEHWLEEFPADSVQYPKELGQSIIKSLTEIYLTVKEFLKPSPANPFYLFNFRDLARVVQGVQLLASKAKVVPAKLSKKGQQDQAVQQVATIIKLFSHETMRVFYDRLSDSNDEKFFKSLLINSVINNFCSPRQEQQENYDLINKYMQNDDDTSLLEAPKQKKGVTFKAGLVVERIFDGYEGVLITKDQVKI